MRETPNRDAVARVIETGVGLARAELNLLRAEILANLRAQITAIVMGAIAVGLAIIGIAFAAVAIAALIAPYVGGPMIAYALIGAACILAALIFFAVARNRLSLKGLTPSRFVENISRMNLGLKGHRHERA